MPLGEQEKALIAQLKAVGGPAFNEMKVEDARLAVLQLFKVENPEQVASVEDKKISTVNGDLPLRIYTPTGDGPHPILMFLHGGGWVVGNIESHDAMCRVLTNAAHCITISVDYRLAPEHKFPAAPDDCYEATKWAVLNAAAIGGDPQRVAVGGDSAGGNLAATVALMAGDRGAPSLAYQLLLYPVTNHAFDTESCKQNGEGYLLTKDDMVWFWDHYLENDEAGNAPYASPLLAKYINSPPPGLVMTAEFDPLRDEGEAYGKKLQDAGADITISRYAGTIHGFFGLFQFDTQKKALAEAAEGLKAAFAQ